MRVYIKEWPDMTATIISESGQVIWTFSSIEDARQACDEWHNIVAGESAMVHTKDRASSFAYANAC